MAETSPGWLKPDDLSSRATASRALELLAAYLDDEQQEQVERFGAFLLDVGTHIFLIPLEGSPWCAHPDDGRVDRLCIAPDRRGGMPEGDVALTYLLWIKSDPDGFLREANVLSTKKIEWPDFETDLVRSLAELAQPPVRHGRRPKPPRKPLKSRRPQLCLDAEQVKKIFHNHGKEVPADLLRKLASR